MAQVMKLWRSPIAGWQVARPVGVVLESRERPLAVGTFTDLRYRAVEARFLRQKLQDRDDAAVL